MDVKLPKVAVPTWAKRLSFVALAAVASYVAQGHLHVNDATVGVVVALVAREADLFLEARVKAQAASPEVPKA